jgi:hypothetical protein
MNVYTPSLPDLWTKFYKQYYTASYPRLMIRFEDTVYRVEEVVEKVRECIGVEPEKDFIQLIGQSKTHGNPTSWLDSLEKYLSDEGRHHGLNHLDRKYTNHVLDDDLMTAFGYMYAPLEVPPKDLLPPFSGQRKKKASMRKRKKKMSMRKPKKKASMRKLKL